MFGEYALLLLALALIALITLVALVTLARGRRGLAAVPVRAGARERVRRRRPFE